MPTTAAAALSAVAYAALYAGHHLGDHVVQLHRDGLRKGMPTDDRLAAGVHPHTGWTSCLRHCATYTATQAGALLLVALVAPIGWAGAAAALAASAGSHAVIDRRWLVRALIRLKGCQDWADAPYLLDQSLHIGALLVAAVLAAAVTGPAGAAAVVAGAGALVGAALLTERRLAATVRVYPPDPSRL